MNANELFKAGQLAGALTALQGEIRAKPEDPRLRIFLFQLNCVLGRWEKALQQLQTVASLNAETMMLATVFRSVIGCEMLRQEVFQGKRQPLIFGEPAEWVSQLVQAGQLTARGEFAAAAELRTQAFAAAPASSGHINGEPFAWLADADTRLGPVLEVILDSKYYWIPFTRIREITLTPPEDVRDLVWLPARFTWINEGQVSGHIPARYAGSDQAADDALKLARKTIWKNEPGETYLGLGQRILATDQNEYPLLACHTIKFDPVHAA